MPRHQGRILITKGLLDQAVQRITSGVIPLFDYVSPIPTITGCTSTPAAVNIATRGRLCKANVIGSSGWLSVQCVIEEIPEEVIEVRAGSSWRDGYRRRVVKRQKRIIVTVTYEGAKYTTEKIVGEDISVSIKDIELHRNEAGGIKVVVNDPVVIG